MHKHGVSPLDGGTPMAWIWTIFLFLSALCALLTGRTAALSAAALEGAGAGIQLALSLAGPLCLWSGLNRVMADGGLTEKLAKGLSPLLRRLFPTACRDREAREALCGNLSANLLGLGNAATPLGIQAVRRMHLLSGGGPASDEMCRLIVMNTASVQLIPATVAAVRAGLGSAAPFDILPAVWITSLCSVTMGLLAAKVGAKWAR